MIVRPTQTGWEVIYHRNHALLAAQLAGQWRKADSPVRLYETIAAISHHDDLEKEWEEDNLTDAGAPKDFTLDSETSYLQLRKHLESALHRGRWVALLTSMHISFLQEGKRGESKEGDTFLDQQLDCQKQWRQELEISQKDVEQAYAFMQWCDRCSLILCQQQIPEDERKLEISKGPDGKDYYIQELKDRQLTVLPWCFEQKSFTVNAEVSTLNQIKFNDNKSLVSALKQAPRKLLEWTFVKSVS
ncbi:MAG: DUF3891 family protein [Aphanocapsa sp. GSE-SYN-MK-11-07L]|jgi:hypothetical protein|nr:DUF3891 family protein [Aphanocapsa sp. GSE-SYN-MK-11-07L]